jgi:hypothetical protein
VIFDELTGVLPMQFYPIFLILIINIAINFVLQWLCFTLALYFAGRIITGYIPGKDAGFVALIAAIAHLITYVISFFIIPGLVHFSSGFVTGLVLIILFYRWLKLGIFGSLALVLLCVAIYIVIVIIVVIIEVTVFAPLFP